MELDKIIPTDGPDINEVEKYINKYQSEVIVIKCGGSVLLDKKLFNPVSYTHLTLPTTLQV